MEMSNATSTNCSQQIIVGKLLLAVTGGQRSNFSGEPRIELVTAQISCENVVDLACLNR